MSEYRRYNRRNVWIAVGAVVLIVLVVVWLIIASFYGDTDVAAHNVLPAVLRPVVTTFLA